MKELSFSTLAGAALDPAIQPPLNRALEDLPERVLQFGTGVLLRGLPDFLIDQANRQGYFNGRIVVVKSTGKGGTDDFERQDNLYTVCVRGMEKGQLISQNIVCSSISRVLSAASQWQEVLACAANPEMGIVLSNTTEAGIELVKEDIGQSPPQSFPAKLLAFLRHRYVHFTGAPDKGLIIIPTELIPNNANKLKEIVLTLCAYNQLDEGFMSWVHQHNHFCNSLVDRIVPGTPIPEMKQEVEALLGCRDELMIVAEPYNLWAIQGDEKVQERLSFHEVNPGIHIEPDIDKFRELKLRMLNGTHTFSCAVAFLSGFSTVKEAMQDHGMSRFISDLMLKEIAAGIRYPMPQDDIQAFGHAVLDRFRNPFLDHRWINISLQFSSKMNARNGSTIAHFIHTGGEVPQRMAMGFAAYLLFMRAQKKEGGIYYGLFKDVWYPIQDPQAERFYDLWQGNTPRQVVEKVLNDKDLWQENLGGLPGFAAQVELFLEDMLTKGVLHVMHEHIG